MLYQVRKIKPATHQHEGRTIAKVANFEPFALTHLECNLQQKLIISFFRVSCTVRNVFYNVCKDVNLLKIYCLHSSRQTDTKKYIISRRRTTVHRTVCCAGSRTHHGPYEMHRRAGWMWPVARSLHCPCSICIVCHITVIMLSTLL